MLNALKRLKHSPKSLFLLLTAFTGILFFLPAHNYQNNIASGDHGKDLYCFWATMKGAVPFQDYWWVYGPLMPYYYAAVLKLLGVTVHSILIGEIILKILAGVCVFLAVAAVSPPVWAYLAALWFWNYYPFFFFTYTHTGGVLLLLAAVACLFHYLDKRTTHALYVGLAAIFFLCLVKLNTGFAALFAFVTSIWLIDRTDRRPTKADRKFYLIALGLVPAAVISVYSIFLRGLPYYVLRQSFPYLGCDRQVSTPVEVNVLIFFGYLASKYFLDPIGILFSAILVLAGGRAAGLLRSPATDKNTKKKFLLSAGTLLIFFTLLLHEFVFSGVVYTISWSTPFSMLFIFILFAFSTRHDSTLSRRLIYTALLLIIVLQGQPWAIVQRKKIDIFWDHPRIRIYSQNSQKWLDTVSQTADYLDKHLGNGETFFALPYDPLYYYLTGRMAPTRQLMFFYNNHIPLAQEVETIKELEQHRVKYIVMSSRAHAQEAGLGIFGETHCQMLAWYIGENFVPVTGFGEWGALPLWVGNHATLIFERK